MSRAILLNANLTALFDIIRPIGSLYSTVDSTFNPNNASGWHGTWERITDCMIYASGDSDTVGEIVGSNTHSITVDEMPSHDHPIPALSGTATGGNHSHKGYTVGVMLAALPQGNYYSAAMNTSGTPDNSTKNSGNLTMSVTTNASTTGSKGSGSAMDLRSRRINSIVWKRIV